MPKNLKKRIFTSLILLSLLFIINFSNLFMLGILLVCLIIQVEFNDIFRKLVGGMLIKYHSYTLILKKFNLKFLVLNTLSIFYLLFIFAPLSVELHGKSGSPVFFLFILSICFFSDIGGYVIGKIIGGKKLTKISPKKTISGTVGSFVFSTIPLLLFYNFDQYEYSFTMNNFLLTLLISLISQIGDLFISYLKRKSKIKDTGKLLPGHDGLLDRVDGIIFAVPFTFFYLYGSDLYVDILLNYFN